jgi:hypothetical protein
VTAGGTFAPGHDQKLRAATEHRAGGLLKLARFIDAAEAYARGQLSSQEFEQRLRATFK